MKIAILWNHPSRLLDCSFRFEQYMRGFRNLGHEPLIVCRRGMEEGFPDRPIVPADERDLVTRELWETVAADVVLVVTWLKMSNVLSAIRSAGTRVVAYTDSDGLEGYLSYPAVRLSRMMVYQDTWIGRARVFKYWLRRCLRGRSGSDEEREFLASVRQADVTVMCSRQAKVNFRRFLEVYGEEGLDDRIVAVPYTIGDSFLSCPVPERKDDCVAAIGRWDDPQKNSRLFVAALERLGGHRPQTAVRIFGAGGEELFAPLTATFPGVRYEGYRRQDTVARALAASRILVVPSRWEGAPHAATEALALGATLVGPSHIPGLLSWSGNGRFGTLTRRRGARALAVAVAGELAAWDAGHRDPRAISAHWRRRLAPEVVCGQLLAAAEECR